MTEDWRILQRAMAVYGRGTIRQPDYRAIALHFRRHISMNTNTEVPSMRHVASLDRLEGSPPVSARGPAGDNFYNTATREGC